MREHARAGRGLARDGNRSVQVGSRFGRGRSHTVFMRAGTLSPAECKKTCTEEFADNRSTRAKTKPSLLVLCRPCRDSVCEHKVVWGKNCWEKKPTKRIQVPSSVDQTCEDVVCVRMCVNLTQPPDSEALWKCRDHHEKGSQRDAQGQLLCTAPNQPTDCRRSYLPS